MDIIKHQALAAWNSPLRRSMYANALAIVPAATRNGIHASFYRYLAFNAMLILHFVHFAVSYVTSSTLWDLVRDAAFLIVLGRLLQPIEDSVLKHGVFGALKQGYRLSASFLFHTLLELPGIRGNVYKKVSKTLDKIESDLIERKDLPEFHSVPSTGMAPRDIEQVFTKFNKMKQSSWEQGRLSGAVYHGDAQLRKLQTQIYGMYTFANQLHPDCFPAVRRMDAEVVAMVLDLYNGPEGSCGTTTSGGTESLLMTCLAARELAKQRGLTKFEIIAPITVHAGIDKAAYYFGMTLVHAPLNPHTMQVDTKAVEKLIGPNTVLLVGSAPNFPHGIIDDIVALGRLAEQYELPLHVDACLGSFIVPFLTELDVRTPLFDFRVPGVTSISCDTHKYGFAPKGSSVIMYRSKEMRRRQYFVSTDWTGGLYASATLAGSRPGALVAGCWATMLYMGRDGYLESAKNIIATARKLKHAIREHPDLFFVYGEPVGSVVAFGSHKINVYDLSDALSKKGWHLSALQNPPALHMACTALTREVVDELVRDIVSLGTTLLKQGSSAKSTDGTKALYGVAGSVSTEGIAGTLAEGFIDILYKT